MYIPHDIVVAQGTKITFKDCVFIERHNFIDYLHVDVLKDEFEGNEIINGYEVWIEEPLSELIDKLQRLSKQEVKFEYDEEEDCCRG
jgi:hypothetical protein